MRPSSASRSPSRSTRGASTPSPRSSARAATPVSEGAPKRHLQEEAREAGWEDEQILEAIAHVALATFGNLVTRAGDVPIDGSTEDSRLAQAA